MARYVKVRGGVAVQYPITETDLKAATGEDYPNGATVRDYLAYGCHQVTPSDYDSSQDSVDEILPALVGVNWTAQWETRAFTAPEFELYTSIKLDDLNDRRIEAELANPTINMARENQVNVLGMLARVNANPANTVRYKDPDGNFTTLNAGDVQTLASDVGTWLNDCYVREGEINALITATASKSALDAVYDAEIDTGWPV